jgi:hypothetical protein
MKSCNHGCDSESKLSGLDEIYMFSCWSDLARVRELRLTAKCKLRDMKVGRSPEQAESTQGYSLGMRGNLHD